MKKSLVIAIDGPAGSGKSSISKEVANQKGIKYIDSGAVYRAITWYILDKYNRVDVNQDYNLDIQNIIINQNFEEGGITKTYVNNIDISLFIRDEKIAQSIGKIADNINIRNYVNELLRKWSQAESIIMDGRDVGTIIFPNAEIKIFLDASVEVRALRRIKEYHELGKNVDEISVKNQIILRDKEDRSRKFGKLEMAKDAIYLDTSNMSKNEVISKIMSLTSSVV